MTTADGWHVLMVETGQEAAVVRDLLRRGHDAYSPMETVWVSPRQAGQRALFPGYVFAALDAGLVERRASGRRQAADAFAWVERLVSAMAAIEARPAVIGFVRFGGDPATVPSDIVERIRAAETLRAFDRTLKRDRRASRFAAGQTVRFASGPWQGLTGVVERAAGERVRLLLDMLGRAAPVEAKEAALEPA